MLAQRLEYTSGEVAAELSAKAVRLSQRLNALRKSLLVRIENEGPNKSTENRKPKTDERQAV